MGIEFHRSRHTPGVQGDQIKWEPREKAIYSKPGHRDDGDVVTIRDGEFKTHPSAPGKVLEVYFSGDPKVYCVDADRLTPTTKKETK